MKQWKQWLPGGLIFLAGFAMLVYGWTSGEAEIVLAKAIRLCLECVGIG